MSSLQFKKQSLEELWSEGDESDGLVCVDIVEGDSSRWSRFYELIFSFDGKLWEASYQRGLTEYQDNGMEWFDESGDLVTAYEVTKVPVTTYKYVRIKD
jgi:hypothetical protein